MKYYDPHEIRGAPFQQIVVIKNDKLIVIWAETVAPMIIPGFPIWGFNC